MLIDFDEQIYISEIKNMVRPLGLGKRQVEKVVDRALLAVRRASKPAYRPMRMRFKRF
ncbi:hypothetical protein MAMMFC1_03698 [Methylomusa anaerophila]|uniref:Uncharacterized protein n=1 Tax=Methylomusa anaerophila TaxID=1930071 RepID=A0A348APJ1_9FIRM|nr:hypothetical protein MAMMFC1_03698 [Methylomusa anaerophila]